MSGAASIPHYRGELERLRNALGCETVAMMQRHEAEGTFDHPEYKAALTILQYRHLGRMQTEPEEWKPSGEGYNPAPDVALWGPSMYCATGRLRNWDRLDQLHRITQPALVLCGFYDQITPACSGLMHRALPNSRIKVFQNSSHAPFWDEHEAYFAEVQVFLDAHSG